LLAYPARQVRKPIRNPMGVAIAKAHIALIASMGISGGTSWASAARTGHASATVSAKSIITYASFLCVFSPPSRLRFGAWLPWGERRERRSFPASRPSA